MTETMLQMAERHRDQDMLKAGTYGFDDDDPGQGCSVGCFAHEIGLEADDHKGYAAHFGLPEWVAYVQDQMYERLKGSPDFHVEFARRAERVRDWASVKTAFLLDVLDVAESAVTMDKWGVKSAIEGVRAAIKIDHAADARAAARAADAAADAAHAARAARAARAVAYAAAYSGQPDAWPRLRDALFTAMDDAA